MSNHKYDYEPIFVFIKPPNPIPYVIVNAGQSGTKGLSECRFHKTEVRREIIQIETQLKGLVLSQLRLSISTRSADNQSEKDKTVLKGIHLQAQFILKTIDRCLE